ncbi:MAG: filamentous hemagglutinin N-terminal domain-containing protein, partial [Cyanobacteria bacterium J06632_3]
MAATSLRISLALWIVSLGGFLTQRPAQAQFNNTVVVDGTSTTLSGDCSGTGLCTIDGGAINGNNIFHTFQTFSVGDGGVRFRDTDPGTTQNVIGQITGSSSSRVNGSITVSADAGTSTDNLFLLNPNGFIFGTGAALNVPGSFVASTAESVVLDSATLNSGDPNILPLLTFSTSVGVQMGANSGDITVSGVTLAGSNGQSLNLIGRNVRLDTGAALQVAGPDGGSIQLQATDTLTLTDRSTVQVVMTGAGTGDDRIYLRAIKLRLCPLEPAKVTPETV